MVEIAQPLPMMEAQVSADTRARLQKSAKEYEGIFVGQMMQAMFKDVDMNPMNEGSSSAEDTYKGMLADQMGNSLARSHGIGLADPIYKSLLQAQIASQTQEKPQ